MPLLALDISNFDRLLENALTKVFSRQPAFKNESDFKFDLFCDLHDLRLDGHRLGWRLPNSPSCLLHAEAKPMNGPHAQKADLLLCNPLQRHRGGKFNYEVKTIVELKLALSKTDLQKELDKYRAYNGINARLYIISANQPKIPETELKKALAVYKNDQVTVLTRHDFANQTDNPPKAVRNGSSNLAQNRLLKQIVQKSIRDTLTLYGPGRRQYQGFFWCNYEHEQTKGWTFPSEGDFNAQLYYFLRSALPNEASISSEYKVQEGKIDLFVKTEAESFAIETKMNWDQFKPKFKERVEAVSEANHIARKFREMRLKRKRHTNILVVIQGTEAFQPHNRAKAVTELSKAREDFDLFYFDEKNSVAMGPSKAS